MAKSKYEKYFIEDDNGRPKNDWRDQAEFQKALPRIASPVLYLDNDMIKGSFYAECMCYNTAVDV